MTDANGKPLSSDAFDDAQSQIAEGDDDSLF